MYVPPQFAETDPEVIAAMIGRVGLAVLVTHGPEGLFASHMPVMRSEDGVFVGHLARANPHRERAGDRAGSGEALLIFPGPEAYVSPGLYPAKAETGRAVPTWNYEAVHVTGALGWFDDRARLLGAVERLSDHHERGRPEPWSVAEAPPDDIEALLRGIVGFELRPTRVEAKRKLSQHRPADERAAVAAGLAEEGAAVVARLMGGEG